MPPRNRDRLGLHELMERYIDGDKLAFARLHARLAPRLRGLLVKLTRDEAAADDLLQLTLLKAHLARERFAPAGGDPDGAVQGWYFAIARNVAMDHLRARYRSELRHDEVPHESASLELPDESASPEEARVRAQTEDAIVQQVREAIAALPPSQREVVELHKLRGMSMAEVAARLQVREGAVRVRAHRAYRALARLLVPVLALLSSYGGMT